MKLTRILAPILCVLAAVTGAMAQTTLPISTSSGGSDLSFVAGKFVANEYSNWGAIAQIYTGNAATGSSTITVRGGYIVLRDGRGVVPFAVGVPFVVNDATPELVTPTAVSGCYKSQGMNQDGILVTCTVTASFSFVHGAGAGLLSGSGGLAEAAQDAFNWGGGIVAIAPGFLLNTSCTSCYTNLANAMANLLVYPNVGFEDDRGPVPTYYNALPSQTAGSYLAAPTTLTSSTVKSGTAACTPAGSCYAGGTIHACVAYVDILGNEGPCSADYSFTDTTAVGIQFSAPAASTGAVGWIPYITLESGAAHHEYQVPLVTQPTVLGTNPASNGVCTLTALETITPACAVANTAYGQSSSGTVTVAAYPVVTSPQAFQLGGVSSTSYYAPNSNAHTTYAYVPGAHPALNGIVSSSEPFTVSAALASTVPFVLGSVAIPANFMNYQGRTIQVCGFVTDAAADVDTITAVQFWWDAQGSNVTTGIPVELANDQITATLTASTNREFCQKFITTVASASATGGTIWGEDGWIAEGQVAAGTIHFMEPNITTAAVGSLNLAESARIDIVFVETTSTVDTPQLQNVTVTVLN
jgi:hypothetical protein